MSKSLDDGYFCKEVADVSLDRKSEEDTSKEVQFCISSARQTGKLKILDVGAGLGRHSIFLAKLGHTISSIEKSVEYSQEALKRAKLAGVSLDWINSDLRDFTREDEFDLAISLYTSFGYHSDAENLSCLGNITRSLKRGGVFVLDMTSRDAVCRDIADVKTLPWGEHGRCEKHNGFDLSTSRRTLDWYFYTGVNLVKTVSLQHRLYSLHELISAFHASGLDIDGTYSDFSKAPISHLDRKIILVGMKK